MSVVHVPECDCDPYKTPCYEVVCDYCHSNVENWCVCSDCGEECVIHWKSQNEAEEAAQRHGINRDGRWFCSVNCSMGADLHTIHPYLHRSALTITSNHPERFHDVKS